MLGRLLLAAALATHGLASLQDLADCDPLKKDSTCPPDPAFAGEAAYDFTKGGWNDEFEAFWSVDDGTSDDKRRLDFETKGKGAAFGMWEAGQAPTLTSKDYLFFGKVTVELQAAKGKGLITAIVLKSDSGDEIDFELLGAYENQAQTNYFHDGKALFNTYNDTHELKPSSFAAFHTYTIQWTESVLAFSIDGIERKAWHVGEIPASKWPQTPMQVKVGLWAVEKGRGDQGELDWAGGAPDWDAAPFKAYFKSVKIEDYMGGCDEVDGDGVEYLYNERTHGWEDVDVKGCKRKTTPGMYTPDKPGDAEPPAETGTGGVPSTSLIGGTGGAPAPTASGTDGAAPSKTGDEEAPPKETGGEGDDEGNDGKGDGKDGDDKNEDDSEAPFALHLSSPLAAIAFFGWMLVF